MTCYEPLVYLASIAIIGGAKSVDEVMRTVKGGFMAVIRVSTSLIRLRRLTDSVDLR